MVIYMDEFRAANSAPVEWLRNGTYGDEIMHANWNPAVLQIVPETTSATPSPELPDDMSTVDVDAFLGRVYALATLI